MDLYELTRKLVRRGCPERPRLVATERYDGAPLVWVLSTVGGKWHHPIDESDARSIWTLWALEWLRDMTAEKDVHVEHHDSTGWQVSSCFDVEWVGPNGKLGKFDFHADHSGPTIIEAIEAATRHLEPKS